MPRRRQGRGDLRPCRAQPVLRPACGGEGHGGRRGAHATAPSATLTLDYSDPARIRLALADDGRGPVPAASAAAPSGGYGLVGLRERCALLGGHLAAGPRPAGGWLLEVDLPT